MVCVAIKNRGTLSRIHKNKHLKITVRLITKFDGLHFATLYNYILYIIYYILYIIYYILYIIYYILYIIYYIHATVKNSWKMAAMKCNLLWIYLMDLKAPNY